MEIERETLLIRDERDSQWRDENRSLAVEYRISESECRVIGRNGLMMRESRDYWWSGGVFGKYLSDPEQEYIREVMRELIAVTSE